MFPKNDLIVGKVHNFIPKRSVGKNPVIIKVTLIKVRYFKLHSVYNTAHQKEMYIFF